MRRLPLADPGDPGQRSATSYLLWVANRQKRTIAAGTSLDIVWLLGLTLVPWAIGHAIDDGILAGDWDELVMWAAIISALSLVRAATEPMRDRAGSSNWMQGAYRTTQLSAHHITRAGQALLSRKSVGEIAAVTGDSFQVGHVYYLIGGLTASLVSYATVAIILLQASPLLGTFVLIGVPLFSGLLLLLGKPISRRQDAQRTAAGKMTALGADLVAGLRIMRGIGGEQLFLRRYADASRTTRDAGMALAKPIALLEGLQVLVGGILVVGMTWIGAVLTVNGDLRPGELVTFYGYAGFLVTPVRLAAEAVTNFSRAHVGAGRVLSVLAVAPMARDQAAGSDAGPIEPAATIHDSTSGLTIVPGTMVGVVAADRLESKALLDRIGRFDDEALVDCPVTWNGRATTDLPLAEVRERIVVIDPEPRFFSGELRYELDPWASHSDAEIMAAVHAAAADDVVDAQPRGLDSETAEGGRTFSGGQRQRLGLARGLLSDASVLLLTDPTSALDAHTEARVASNLPRVRHGRTTVVATANPSLLREMDVVHLLVSGAVVSSGTHHELMDDERYRDVVQRGEG